MILREAEARPREQFVDVDLLVYDEDVLVVPPAPLSPGYVGRRTPDVAGGGRYKNWSDASILTEDE